MICGLMWNVAVQNVVDGHLSDLRQVRKQPNSRSSISSKNRVIFPFSFSNQRQETDMFEEKKQEHWKKPSARKSTNSVAWCLALSVAWLMSIFESVDWLSVGAFAFYYMHVLYGNGKTSSAFDGCWFIIHYIIINRGYLKLGSLIAYFIFRPDSIMLFFISIAFIISHRTR